jgi:Concanavalin A-like lectin/glucanases superfamily
VWFRDAHPTYNHARTRILTNGDIGLPDVPYFASIDGGLLIVGLRSNGNAQVVTLNLAAAGVTPSTWHHLAASFDADTRVMRIYIDGVERASGQLAFGSAGTNLPLIVGRSGGTGNYWAGGLDDLRLWSVVRTAADIRASFDREIVGTPPGLVGNWHFDEGRGLRGRRCRRNAAEPHPAGRRRLGCRLIYPLRGLSGGGPNAVDSPHRDHVQGPVGAGRVL